MNCRLAAWCMVVCVSMVRLAYADASRVADVPLVQRTLAGPADVPAIDLERQSLLLQELGFSEQADALRRFSERRGLWALLGEQHASPATLADAIALEARETQSLSALQEDVVHGVSFAMADASSGLVAPATPGNQVGGGHLSAVTLAPNVWGWVDNNTAHRAGGWADSFQLFVALQASNHLSADVDVSARFGVAGEVQLACDARKVMARSSSVVYCHTDMLQPSVRSAVAKAVQALASGDQALSMRSMTVTGPDFQSWSYDGTLPLRWQPPGSELTLDGVRRQLGAASCKELGNCWGRLGHVVSGAKSPGFLLGLLIVFGTAWMRWIRADGTSPPAAFRAVFLGYAVLCMGAAMLALLESFSQAPLKGVLSKTFSLLLALPWSSSLVETRQMPRQYGHGGMSDASAAWIFIVVNLAWLAFLAYYRGASRSRASVRRLVRK